MIVVELTYTAEVVRYFQEEAFVAGIAFTVLFTFLCTLFELPFAIRELVWSNRRKHRCYLRCRGWLEDPCHYAGCPRSDVCPYYQKRTVWDLICEKIKKVYYKICRRSAGF